MYPRPRINGYNKLDPYARWHLKDRVFFACGACHILAYAFMIRYKPERGKIVWIKPKNDYSGNHIYVELEGIIFDYHGYSSQTDYLEHTFKRARHYWSGWDADFIELPMEALISGNKSQEYDGLWLREPDQFLYDALPRAYDYLNRFPRIYE